VAERYGEGGGAGGGVLCLQSIKCNAII